MNRLNEKIDITQVIIAPVYKLNSNNGHIDINNPYVHAKKWIAIYPIDGTNYRSFYNLSDNFNIINLKSNNYKDELVVDLNNSKFLVDYLDDLKRVTKKRYISYKNLLYIIIPITQYEKYKNLKMKNKRSKIKNNRKYIVDDVFYKNHIEYNCFLEKKTHFAINVEDNEPISYGYISDEIPYVKRR